MPYPDNAISQLERAGLEGTSEIAYALMRLALAMENVAVQLKYLGNGDAATPMGALEAFGLHMGEKLDAIAEALSLRDAA